MYVFISVLDPQGRDWPDLDLILEEEEKFDPDPDGHPGI